jgi:hypothetical protein
MKLDDGGNGASPRMSDVTWEWYKGQRYELIMPLHFLGRWVWIAHFDAGSTVIGKAFSKRTAVEKAKRAIKKTIREPGRERAIPATSSTHLSG